MASDEITVVAIIPPKAGKVDRLTELLKELIAYVEKNEPSTLMYHLHRQINVETGTEEIIMLEKYENEAAQKLHQESTPFKTFFKAVQDEELVSGHPVLKFMKSEAGFASRV